MTGSQLYTSKRPKKSVRAQVVTVAYQKQTHIPLIPQRHSNWELDTQYRDILLDIVILLTQVSQAVNELDENRLQ